MSAPEPPISSPVQPGAVPPPVYGAAAPARPRSGNVFGLVGVIAAAAGFVLLEVFNVVGQLSLYHAGYSIGGLLIAIGGVLALVGYAVALVFGLVGLTRPGLPHGLAGIATGAGALGALTVLGGWLISAVMTAVIR